MFEGMWSWIIFWGLLALASGIAVWAMWDYTRPPDPRRHLVPPLGEVQGWPTEGDE